MLSMFAVHWSSPMLPMFPEPWMSPTPRVRITQRNGNIYCPYGLKYHKSFDFNDHRFLRHSRTPSTYEFSRLGLRRVTEPEKLEYASYESRLNSFAGWPTHLRQTSEELADAGFYYIGIMDLTVCYHCGICIENWGPEEHPWEKHAISSPGCYYLLTVRGFKYANNVTGQELYETSTEAPTQIANGNPERSNSENDTNEMTLVQKIAAAKEKNRALKNARLCKVCMEREATVVFLPCGHVATCDYCSPALTKCIICRGELKATSSAIFL
ncbi:baculoviral IAP repeat-containing protein 7-A-like [Bombus affinis]|uniref:baculoviral IAP repeat-containing protein 7-A-like n=1 Tax=Bombus affinis TaxID=309941 RepID=UPI0021B7FEEF|nr:baculoviral IAP repeat-containing protein 7-A-like [Bombus affinis]